MTFALLLGMPALARAQATPEEKCAAAKMRAVGKSVQLRLGCLARATVAFDFDVDLCLEKAEAQLATVFAKVEDKGGCDAVGEGPVFEVMVQDFVDDVELDLAP